MKGLLIKDFKLLNVQKNFFAAIIAICFVMIVMTDDASFAIGFLGFSGMLFMLSSISYDEFDNGNAFLFSLPVTREEYVLEKYGFGLIVSSCAWLFGVLISILFSETNNSGLFEEKISSAVALFLTVVIMLAIMTPIQLKFGGEKSRIAILGIVGIVCVFGILVGRIQNVLEIDFSPVLNRLAAVGDHTFLVIMLIVAIAAIILSYWISRTIICKKEF